MTPAGRGPRAAGGGGRAALSNDSLINGDTELAGRVRRPLTRSFQRLEVKIEDGRDTGHPAYEHNACVCVVLWHKCQCAVTDMTVCLHPGAMGGAVNVLCECVCVRACVRARK